MPVDYSKWDTLDVSNSDDTDRQSASSSSDSGPGESHQPVTDTLNELVAEEQRELRRFLRAHPCPTKSAITAWAQKVFEGSPMGEAGERLRCALADKTSNMKRSQKCGTCWRPGD